MDPQYARRRRAAALAVAGAIILLDYYQRDDSGQGRPRMTSTLKGVKWLDEMLTGHPTRFWDIFRMSQEIFLDLLRELCANHGLRGSMRTAPREVLGITIYILSQNQSVRGAVERFQHSSETIHRYFARGLEALTSLSRVVIQPEDPTFARIPNEIMIDKRYMPFFENCIGAIDGTHIEARIPDYAKVPYIGRSGYTTQNVLAVCDFNMCFTFVTAGWEGSAHDSRMFRHATGNRSEGFPHPPPGKYYLVDAGFPMPRGFLKPFLKTRYHVPEFGRDRGVARGRKEIFNKRHSSLRGVIERTFGVWKKKWVILRDMPAYPFPKQVRIVIATMALHNFIRRHPSRSDSDFSTAAADESTYESQEPDSESEAADVGVEDMEGATEMKALRERITDALCAA